MFNKKFKRTILTVLISSICFSSYAQDSQKASHDGEEDIKKVLENNTALNKSDYILQYYREKGALGKTAMGNHYELKEPMEMRELYKLEHEYFRDGGRTNMSLKELNKRIIEQSNEDVKSLRKNSVYNEALMIGVQNGLFKVLYDFKQNLEVIGSELEGIFNFNELMLAKGKVIPPVILAFDSGVEKEGDLKLRVSDGGFEIYKQAKVAINVPTYLDYLQFEPIKPKEPEDLLLPINDEERKLWEAGAKEGWILGLKQGNAIINEGLSSLYRDYSGMTRFHIMKDSGMISMPSLNKMNIGTTTDGTKLNVGEITFEVVILPEFNANTQNWEPLPQIDDFLFKENNNN